MDSLGNENSNDPIVRAAKSASIDPARRARTIPAPAMFTSTTEPISAELVGEEALEPAPRLSEDRPPVCSPNASESTRPRSPREAVRARMAWARSAMRASSASAACDASRRSGTERVVPTLPSDAAIDRRISGRGSLSQAASSASSMSGPDHVPERDGRVPARLGVRVVATPRQGIDRPFVARAARSP